MNYRRKHSPYWTAAFYVKGADGTLIKRAYCTKTDDKEKALDIEREVKIPRCKQRGIFITASFEAV